MLILRAPWRTVFRIDEKFYERDTIKITLRIIVTTRKQLSKQYTNKLSIQKAERPSI
jgi:hypothetical protein